VLGVALFGVTLLLPLYFELLRGRTPVQTGLLMIPQGLGAAAAISLAGYLTDRVGARRVVLAGILVALAGVGWFTQIGAHTSYSALVIALFLIGAGLGATITPAMAAAASPHAAAALAQAFGVSFAVALAITVPALIPAVPLPRKEA
jgi:MFS family permease